MRLPTLAACSLTLAVAAAQDPAWRRDDLGDAVWQEHTRAVTVAARGVLLHGREVHVVGEDGRLEARGPLLARPVDAFSAVGAVEGGIIVVVPGRGEPAFRFDPARGTCTDIPGLALHTGRGARVAGDGRGALFVTLGSGAHQWVCWVGGQAQTLQPVETVNMPGKYASALYHMGNKLLALGDHHVSSFDLDLAKWDGTNRLYRVLGFRPALDRGGMFCQDPVSQWVWCVHGKESRAIGVLTARREFFYLRPRLPFPARDQGETLFLTGSGNALRLNLLSQVERALFSIRVDELQVIDTAHREVEAGSRWQVWNLLKPGAVGDLVRERDSTGNALFLDPCVYVHRKNAMRSIEYDDWKHSDWNGAPEFGPEFARKGSAICSDGRLIYVNDGSSNDFYALDLHMGEDGKASPTRLHINVARVRKLAPLRSFPAATNNDDLPQNMTMVCHGGKVWALRDPVTRILHVYDPPSDRWAEHTLLPGAVRYSDAFGADLMSDGERLWLLSGDALTSYAPQSGWGPLHRLGFAYTSDGGAAVYDARAKLIYVVIGGRSRDLGVIDPSNGAHRLLRDFLPDVVSVHGRRLFLVERDGVQWLNLQRGHDSAEFWRTAVSGDGALSPR